MTIEEGAAGCFGALTMQHLAGRGLLDRGLKFRPMTLPDRLIDHNAPAKQYERPSAKSLLVRARQMDPLR